MPSPDPSSDDMDQEETFAGGSHRPQRNRTQTRRLKDAMANMTEVRTAKAAKQTRVLERTQNRAQRDVAATTVVRASDNKELRRLKELLHTTQATLNATEEELLAARASVEGSNAPAAGREDDSIPRPVRMDHVSIDLLRQYMDLEGADHDDEWSHIRSTVREYLRKGRIQWSRGWKGQRALQLGKIYDAIETKIPVLRRFCGSWATEYLTKNAFNNHKTYDMCKNDGSKYRGKVKRLRKQAAARRKQQRSLEFNSDGEQEGHSDEQVGSLVEEEESD